MEYEKIGANSKLFIFGMICLVISLGLLLLSLYILPYFLWELHYSVPDFILELLASYQDDYGYSLGTSKAIVWFSFFGPCVVFGLISYFASRHLDSLQYEIPSTSNSEKSNIDIQKELKDSAGLGFKIIGLIVLIFLGIWLVQYVLQSSVSTPVVY